MEENPTETYPDKTLEYIQATLRKDSTEIEG